MEPEDWGGNFDSWELSQCFTDWMSPCALAVPFLQGRVRGGRRCLVVGFGESYQQWAGAALGEEPEVSHGTNTVWKG